jgi:HD-like signal output (HDOD) protein
MVHAEQKRLRVTELIGFCKEHFDITLVIASSNNELIRCMAFHRDGNGQLVQNDYRDIKATLDSDPIFKSVDGTNLPFFGKVFSSDLLDAVGVRLPDSEIDCAVIPLGAVDNMNVLLYVSADGTAEAPGPFDYLELLSSQINPPADDPHKAEHEPPSLPAAPAPPAPADADTPPEPEEQLKRMVETVKELPAMPNVVGRILELLSCPDSAMTELADVISHDQALVARLIKVSNSAFYGRGQKISTLSQAVVMLGTRTIRSLVVAASTRSLFPTDNTAIGMWGQSLWRHSVECGLASRRVAERIRYADPEEAFIGGILHDVGKIVMLLNMPDEYRRVIKNQSSARKCSAVAEQNVLGFDHTMVGELLLDKWNMLPSLMACIRYHHHPHDSVDTDVLPWIIACGNYLSHACGARPDETLAEASTDIESVAVNLGLFEEDLPALRKNVADDFEHSDILD